jgi:hypothetical protein
MINEAVQSSSFRDLPRYKPIVKPRPTPPESKFFGLMRRESSQHQELLGRYLSRENFSKSVPPSKTPFSDRVITPVTFELSLKNHFEKTKGISGIKSRRLMTEIRESLNFRKHQVSKLI